jgi:glycosyltransferase involved in cell wall biosynthesis
MRVALLTAGDPRRLTGGYLYHARVFELLRPLGVTVDDIVVSAGTALDAQRAVARGLAAFDARVAAADVVVVDALACLACAPRLDAWQAARPIVAMVHELPSIASGVGVADLLAAEDALLRLDTIVTVSEHGRAVLAGHGVNAERIHVVAPGRDRVQPVPAHVRDRDEPLRVLCVAQWIPRKGIDTLVAAWARVMPHSRGAVLELVGETDADPEYAARVRAAIAAAQDAHIVVRGAISDAELAHAYAVADVFALPSRYEGYGMVFAEALSHGLPVVAGDVGPAPEVVGHDAGWFVPPDDVAALADALRTLIADGARRARMARAARERAGALPTWRDTAERFHAVLIEAMAHTPRHATRPA